MVALFGSPAAQWDEKAGSGGIGALTVLLPYKTVGGYWVLLPVGATPPSGAVQGAAVQGTGYDTLTTATTVGLRHTRAPSGYVFSY